MTLSPLHRVMVASYHIVLQQVPLFAIAIREALHVSMMASHHVALHGPQ